MSRKLLSVVMLVAVVVVSLTAAFTLVPSIAPSELGIRKTAYYLHGRIFGTSTSGIEAPNVTAEGVVQVLRNADKVASEGIVPFLTGLLSSLGSAAQNANCTLGAATLFTLYLLWNGYRKGTIAKALGNLSNVWSFGGLGKLMMLLGVAGAVGIPATSGIQGVMEFGSQALIIGVVLAALVLFQNRIKGSLVNLAGMVATILIVLLAFAVIGGPTIRPALSAFTDTVAPVISSTGPLLKAATNSASMLGQGMSPVGRLWLICIICAVVGNFLSSYKGGGGGEQKAGEKPEGGGHGKGKKK